MTLPIMPPQPGQGLTTRGVKLCGLKLKVKFTVEAGFNDDGEAEGWFYPVGEKVKTKKDDEWGSLGQGVGGQELNLEVLGCDSQNRLMDFETAMTPIEMDTFNTTLDPYKKGKQEIEMEMTVYFICCSCQLRDGTSNIQDCEECCKFENFAQPGGGHRSGLGGWRNGFFRDRENPDNRTPTYATPIQIGPPGDELKELRDKMHQLFRSDIIMGASRSYANLCCWNEEEGPTPLGPDGHPPPRSHTRPTP